MTAGEEVREKPAVYSTGADKPHILSTQGLTKRFGGIVAIDNIDFKLKRGELRCLIGPNGAGKSTLISLITGQLTPTSGEIHYNGENITDWEPHDRINSGISLKFQSPNVYDKLTVQENLRIPLQKNQTGKIRKLASEVLQRINMSTDTLDKRADSLSHGQQQRLEIGMAMAMDPSLLLLDEPVAGLSLEEQQNIADLVKSLNKEDEITILVIEHEIGFVEKVAEKVTVLHQGSIFREGTIEEIKNDSDVRRIYLGGE